MHQHIIAEGRPVLADGARGANLFEARLISGGDPKGWNAALAGRIRAPRPSFKGAGARIILTNSLGGVRGRLALHGVEGKARELTRLAARNARHAAVATGRREGAPRLAAAPGSRASLDQPPARSRRRDGEGA